MDQPKIVTKTEAMWLGLKRYYTGVPCIRGHLAERRVKGDACVECQKLAQAAWKAEKPDYHREWKSGNQDRVAGYKEKYGPEYFRKKGLEHYYRNKEAYLAHARKRKARKMGADGDFTKADIDRIMKAQGGRCAHCKTSVKRRRHIDHIIPLARGGSNWPSNLQILCPQCNMSKGSKDPIDWARINGRLL
jgi:5-methylcytosine-specific restriction endonuclease McrA